MTKDKKIFLIIVLIAFSIYSFTSHGHRYTSDEYVAFVQADRIVNQKATPDLIPEEYKLHIEGRGRSIDGSPAVCKDGILCSFVPIGHAISYVPFIYFEKNLSIIPPSTFTNNDFNDPHYVWWRNSVPHEETFTFLFFGPLITSLSVGIVFLINRTYECSQKTSIAVAFLYGFTTISFAYSTTGFNIIEGTLMILLSFLFYRRFKKTNSSINLIFVAMSLGFGLTVRYDTAIFALVLSSFLIIEIMKKKQRVRNVVMFVIPIIFFVSIIVYVDVIRFGSPLGTATIAKAPTGPGNTTPLHLGIFGLLFSPGAGIFIFAPILLTAFISFVDLYRKDKFEVLPFIAYISVMLIFFGSWTSWHGFVGWSARYMIPIIPFLLIPLGISIKKRKNRLFKISLIPLAALGAFFSFLWLAQDVSWFVWGQMGQERGLYGISSAGLHPLGLSPVVFWTFEYSQLTHATNLIFTNWQIDLYLFKVLGTTTSFIIITIIILPCSIYLHYLLRQKKFENQKTSNEM